MTLQAPPKILVIYAHPDPQASLANAEMIRAIAGLPHVTIHDLYGAYPDFFIDVAREQALIAQHEIVVFQHPLYMYSCPALLKEWIDVVLGKGYAHGDGNALQGKYWRSVITTGGAAEAILLMVITAPILMRSLNLSNLLQICVKCTGCHLWCCTGHVVFLKQSANTMPSFTMIG